MKATRKDEFADALKNFVNSIFVHKNVTRVQKSSYANIGRVRSAWAATRVSNDRFIE